VWHFSEVDVPKESGIFEGSEDGTQWGSNAEAG
jgi:hypothetical protein